MLTYFRRYIVSVRHSVYFVFFLFFPAVQGVGWSVPVLEKILAAVKGNLTIENCCDQLRAILMLKRIIKLKTQEEGEECYPEVRTLSQRPSVYLVTSELFSYGQL